jgi:hypothetical protein
VKVRYTTADGFVPDYKAEPAPEPVPDPGTPPPNVGDLEARVSAIEAWIRRVL